MSRLYESAPAYVTEQPAFLNAALLALTPLAPLELLAALKAVEVGPRVGTFVIGTPACLIATLLVLSWQLCGPETEFLQVAVSGGLCA